MDLLTDAEVEEVDQAMDRHMRHHSISNNVLSWTCSAECRRSALGMAINRVIAEKGVEGEKELDLNPVRLLREETPFDLAGRNLLGEEVRDERPTED